MQFSTRCGSVSGVAFRDRGELETHYTVQSALALPDDSMTTTINASMSQIGEQVGAFQIVGQVNFRFDDGLFAVFAHGFDFLIEPDQVDVPVVLGSWMRLTICDFTLYI